MVNAARQEGAGNLQGQRCWSLGGGGTPPGGAEKAALLQDLEDLVRNLVSDQRARLSEPQCSDMGRICSPQQNSGLASRQERIPGQLQGG